MGGLHLVQREGAWAGPQPAQPSPRCTKCNSPPTVVGEGHSHLACTCRTRRGSSWGPGCTGQSCRVSHQARAPSKPVALSTARAGAWWRHVNIRRIRSQSWHTVRSSYDRTVPSSSESRCGQRRPLQTHRCGSTLCSRPSALQLSTQSPVKQEPITRKAGKIAAACFMGNKSN